MNIIILNPIQLVKILLCSWVLVERLPPFDSRSVWAIFKTFKDILVMLRLVSLCVSVKDAGVLATWQSGYRF